MTVTPINEPGLANVLADKNAYCSETRLDEYFRIRTRFSATGTDRFTLR